MGCYCHEPNYEKRNLLVLHITLLNDIPFAKSTVYCFFQIHFYLCVCMCIWESVCRVCGHHQDPEKGTGSLEQELQMVVQCLLWVLRNEH